VYCEDDKAELHRRTASVAGGERISISSLEEMKLVCRKGKDSILFDAQFNDMTGRFTPAFERLRATAIELGAQVLVLDSLYDFFGGNENSKTQVKQFINGLADLAHDLNGSVILVAHPSLSGMGSGSGTAGSTAWHNAVRSRLYLHRRKPAQWELDKNPQARGPLILQPMKSNYGPPESAIELVWEEGRFVPVVDPHLSTLPDNRMPVGDRS
jgi:RecA-family ATPase